MQGSAAEVIGADWLHDKVDAMADHIERVRPVAYNEEYRYLPAALSPRPGFIRYDLFPFLREPIECFDTRSPVREVNFKKGVQVGYTTLLESIMFFYIGHVKTQGMMFLTADKELATIRMENNILPMLNESDMGHLIRSADEGNSRKTGKNKDLIQWDGGGFMIPAGAQNATKMRQTSVPLLLKDELDGWKRSVGKDGNSDVLTNARCNAYWDVRKILRGSTPLLVPSMIHEAYERGDQRKYMVLCKKCSFPQEIRQQRINKETGVISGFVWETEDGTLLLESVRYLCENCQHPHREEDKERLFSEEHGAHWKPTAKPREPGIRSYHLPGWYSPFGFTPWSKCIADYLDAYDPINKVTKSIDKFQTYYNNVLGEPFAVQGSKVRFESVSAHRRTSYKFGQIPNTYAKEYSASPVLFLTCQVDVHKRNLAVTVTGWCRDMRNYTIDYWRFETTNDDESCEDLTCPTWGRLRELIEEKEYTADDGQRYRIARTFIDASYASDTVVTFCSDYASGVYPIMGRERPAKFQKVSEFGEFTTQAGTIGYRLTVDHYKDRMGTVLRREWMEEAGVQPAHHFNAPVDASDKQIKELTAETRREVTDTKGNKSYEWYRPGNIPNEWFDLLGYGYANVEVFAWDICTKRFQLETVDWDRFWDFAALPENDEIFARLAPIAQ